jgi:prepilin-type N-terminal cleavage/methylation domain-containing protein
MRRGFTLIELLVVIAIIASRRHPLPRVRSGEGEGSAEQLSEQRQATAAKHLDVRPGLRRDLLSRAEREWSLVSVDAAIHQQRPDSLLSL